MNKKHLWQTANEGERPDPQGFRLDRQLEQSTERGESSQRSFCSRRVGYKIARKRQWIARATLIQKARSNLFGSDFILSVYQ